MLQSSKHITVALLTVSLHSARVALK